MRTLEGIGKVESPGRIGDGKLLSAIWAATEQEPELGVFRVVALAVCGLAIACFVGALELVLPREIELHFLYLAGGVLIGWWGGLRVAVPGMLLSVAFLWLDEMRGNHGGENGWLLLNLVVQFTGFCLITGAAARVGRRARDLGDTVQKRTQSLRVEVDDHRATAMKWREMAQLFRQFTENTTEMFWVSDPARRRLNYLSPGYERIWGRECKEAYLRSRAWLDAVHEEDRSRLVQAIEQEQANGAYSQEYRIIRPDGTVRWVHDRAFPVRDEQQKVLRLVGITEDITERKRDEQLRQAEREISYALSVTSDLALALEGVLEGLLRIEGVSGGGVYLLDGNGRFKLCAYRGLSWSLAEEIGHLDCGRVEASVMRCWQSAQTRLGKEEFKTIDVIALRRREEVFGFVCLTSRMPHGIAGPTLGRLENIVAQTSVAILRIRLERQILEISDREQARIGQDIHDGLCQQLVGAAFAANALEQTLAVQAHPEVEKAKRIGRLLDGAMTESRRVARGLYPIRLRTEGLVEALEELARTTNACFGTQCICQTGTRAVHCPEEISIHLYRIAQEAVSNAVKHSQAGLICIRLEANDEMIELEVKDNGKGILSPVPPGKGMGLNIMDYRARSIGGTLMIRQDAGTSVACRVSLARGDANES